jgi:hypothetical protein
MPVHMELMVDKVALGQAFLSIFWFPHQHCPTNAPYSHFIHLPLTPQNLRKKLRVLLNKPHPHPLQAHEGRSFMTPCSLHTYKHLKKEGINSFEDNICCSLAHSVAAFQLLSIRISRVKWDQCSFILAKLDCTSDASC